MRDQALNDCYQSRRSEGFLKAVNFSIEYGVSSLLGQITGNHDYRQFRPLFLDTSDKINSVKVWQDHVCDDKFAVGTGKQSQRLDTIAGFHDFIAIGSQGIGKIGAAYDVVFDYKDQYDVMVTLSEALKQGLPERWEFVARRAIS
jgi:hypothetical protein